MRLILFFTFIFNLTLAAGQTIVRGPYMQSNTHESIIFMWRTSTTTDTKVWYGTDPNNLNLTKVISNNVKDHIVKVDGLSALTTYYYAVGTTSGVLAGGTASYTFKTHPVPGTPTPTRIWAIGDFGRGNQGQVDCKQSFENYTGTRGADVWLWLGDNAYQDGSDAEYQSKVFAVNGFSDVFSRLPFYPCPGNHDYNSVWPASTALGIPYSNIPLADHKGPYYDMVEVPKYAEAGGYPSQLEVFYSFDYGDVHFLSLNSEVFDYTLSYSGINQMIQWIRNDLNQNTRKFTIAFFHQCPYSKGSHDSDAAYELVIKAMREKIIPVLEEYDVDLVVNGHSHVFERSYLMNGHFGKSDSFNASTMVKSSTNGKFSDGNAYIKDNSYATQNGTVYVVCGNSGSSEGGPALNHPAMLYSDGGSSAYGSFVIDVYKNRLDAKYLKSDGQIGDEFTILKKDLVLQSLSNLTICKGQSANVQALFTGGSDNLEIKWTAGSNITSGTTTTLSPATTTTYTLSVKDLYTQQVETTTFTITVTELPVPVINQPLPGTLEAVSSVQNVSYQWNINSNPITGATSNYYTPQFDGNYTVTITNQQGCSATSEVFVAQSLSVEETAASTLKLFPNPADNQITFSISDNMINSPYSVIDNQGRVILSGIADSKNTILNINSLVPGNYILRIKKEEKTINQSFIKK